MTVHFKPSNAGKPNGRKPNEANRVRIIGGDWRSRIIEFPAVEGLRPTGNRVREMLFNWLGQSLHEKRCLDLFAGSGALGFEAASRGATDVVMVENSRIAMIALQKNQMKLAARQCRLIFGDAKDFLARNADKFDVIFLDPPFGSGLITPLLTHIAGLLNEGGMVYAECENRLAATLLETPHAPWELLKQGRAGAVHFGLLSIAKGST